MQLVLDIATSAEFWRQRYPLDRAPIIQSVSIPIECACAKRDVFAHAPSWIDAEFLAPLDGVLHVLSFDGRQRFKSNAHIVHTWSDDVPENSLVALKDGTLVMTPCFMFLMAASILSKHSLIAFGDELCGLYSFDAREKRGFRKRQVPLVSKAELNEYILGAAGLKGCRKAKDALVHVVDNSASPMETYDEMSMCLPYRLGGYGVPSFDMNVEVPLTPKAALIAQRDTCYLDMGCLNPKLDVEHHGCYDHTDPEDVVRDLARVNGLKEMGFEVIELTSQQVNDLRAYEAIVDRIAKMRAKYIDKSKRGPTAERLLLREEVSRWNRSGGRIR